jgi:hypothetical protein
VTAEDLTRLLRLAGVALAHAAWSVEDGETLCTLAVVEAGGERAIHRYACHSIAESVEAAHRQLAEELQPGDGAALVFDGYATRQDGVRTHALVVELLGPGDEPLGRILQPYEAARGAKIPFVGRRERLRAARRADPVAGHPDRRRQMHIIEGARKHPEGARLFPS